MAKQETEYNTFVEEGIRYMQCSNCGSYVENISEKLKSVLCYRCTLVKALNLWNPFIKKSTNRKPKGWHWMSEFVDKDGNVFHKGKEMPKLKGTLPPTEIKKTVRKKKKKKKESFEKKINTMAKEYKQKQKLKKEQQLGINK
tara:strand:- start:317 stop:742 length:426 start_codon:yes stop_codon:yes gene_type:complete